MPGMNYFKQYVLQVLSVDLQFHTILWNFSLSFLLNLCTEIRLLME